MVVFGGYNAQGNLSGKTYVFNTGTQLLVSGLVFCLLLPRRLAYSFPRSACLEGRSPKKYG